MDTQVVTYFVCVFTALQHVTLSGLFIRRVLGGCFSSEKGISSQVHHNHNRWPRECFQ